MDQDGPGTDKGNSRDRQRGDSRWIVRNVAESEHVVEPILGDDRKQGGGNGYHDVGMQARALSLGCPLKANQTAAKGGQQDPQKPDQLKADRYAGKFFHIFPPC